MNDMINFFAAWVDGTGYRVGLESAKIPAMKDQGEDFRGGGMNASMDMPLGLEKFEASIMMGSIDPPLLKKAGLAVGKFNRITLRGNLVNQFSDEEKPVIAIIEGRLSADPKEWKAGTKSGVEYPITAIRYYKLLIDGDVMYEQDVLGMVGVVGDEDQLANARKNLGF